MRRLFGPRSLAARRQKLALHLVERREIVGGPPGQTGSAAEQHYTGRSPVHRRRCAHRPSRRRARDGLKLFDAAEKRWRRFDGHTHVSDVLDGVVFRDGEKVTDTDTTTPTNNTSMRNVTAIPIASLWS